MHRLACLRDDAIFIVYVYQRWKYRTDYSRVNEFGQCENPTEEMMIEESQKEACKEDERKDNNPEREAENEKVVTEKGVTDYSSGHCATTVRKRRGAREKGLS